MRKIVFWGIMICILVSCPLASAETSGNKNDAVSMLDQHGAIMLMIEPQSGAIVYANSAAVSFYGYSKGQLLSMKIDQINVLSAQETEREIRAAAEQSRNYFEFKHRLADGRIRDVEVYSYPVSDQNKEVLFSIVHDVTQKAALERREKEIIRVMIFGSLFMIAVLLLLLVVILKSTKKLKKQKKSLNIITRQEKCFLMPMTAWCI